MQKVNESTDEPRKNDCDLFQATSHPSELFGYSTISHGNRHDWTPYRNPQMAVDNCIHSHSSRNHPMKRWIEGVLEDGLNFDAAQ